MHMPFCTLCWIPAQTERKFWKLAHSNFPNLVALVSAKDVQANQVFVSVVLNFQFTATSVNPERASLMDLLNRNGFPCV